MNTLFLLKKKFNYIIDDSKKFRKKNISNNNKILLFYFFSFFFPRYCMCCLPSEFYEMSAGVLFCSVKFGALNFPFEPRPSSAGRQDPVGRLVAPEKTVARKFD